MKNEVQHIFEFDGHSFEIDLKHKEDMNILT